MDQDEASLFLSSLSDFLKYFCSTHIHFDKSTLVTGHLVISVDNGENTEFTVNENICKIKSSKENKASCSNEVPSINLNHSVQKIANNDNDELSSAIFEDVTIKSDLDEDMKNVFDLENAEIIETFPTDTESHMMAACEMKLNKECCFETEMCINDEETKVKPDEFYNCAQCLAERHGTFLSDKNTQDVAHSVNKSTHHKKRERLEQKSSRRGQLPRDIIETNMKLHQNSLLQNVLIDQTEGH